MTEPMSKPPRERAQSGTRERLIEAAAVEFNSTGFHGTDTNKIARRAGFAPQTFYRHLTDKTDAFIAVYREWQERERRQVVAAYEAPLDAGERHVVVAEIILSAHREWRVFRRSLRLLAVEDDRVRQSRADGRRAQLKALGQLYPDLAVRLTDGYAELLVIERLCDAAADDEIVDMGIAEADWTIQVAAAVRRLTS